MKLRPMLQVGAIARSREWYGAVLGLRSGHGGDEFEMLFDGDEFVLQLHRPDADEHGLLAPAPGVPAGVGVSMWFETDDRDGFDAVIARARATGATVAREPGWNPLAHHHEVTFVDPDGYLVVVHTPFDPTS